MTDFLSLNVTGKYSSLFELPANSLPADERNKQISCNASRLFKLPATSLPADERNKQVLVIHDSSLFLHLDERHEPPRIDNVLDIRRKWFGLKDRAVDRE